MNDEIGYKLGIIWQDVQHRRIVKIIKEISSGLHVNFDSIFNQLTYYIEDHFDTEEQRHVLPMILSIQLYHRS